MPVLVRIVSIRACCHACAPQVEREKAKDCLLPALLSWAPSHSPTLVPTDPPTHTPSLTPSLPPTRSPTDMPTLAPTDPCKKWEAEDTANKAVAEALKSEVGFADDSTAISSSGKATLDKVANVLKQYPWMTIAVEAHSDAQAGSTCTTLTEGRAASTEEYLKSQGVTNPMGKPAGKCGVKRAVVIEIAHHARAKPAGCTGLMADELLQTALTGHADLPSTEAAANWAEFLAH